MTPDAPDSPDEGSLRELVPPKPALVLATTLLGSLTLCAVIPIYFGGLGALLGFVMGVMGGVACALASASRMTKISTCLLYAGAGALGVSVADDPRLAAAAVLATGLVQAPLNARAASLGIFLPVLVSVFSTVSFPTAPFEDAAPTAGGLGADAVGMAVWVLCGFVAIQWLARLFNLPTIESRLDHATVWRHALVFAVAAAAIQYLLMEWGTPHGYWLVLTLASVLRPVAGETRAVAIDRTLGTVAGVFLAMVIIWTFPQAIALLLALPCTVFMIAWAVMQDLRKQTMFGTPGVVLFGSAGAVDLSLDVAGERLLLTFLGVLVAAGAVLVLDLLGRRA